MAAHLPAVKKKKQKSSHSYLDLDNPKVQEAFRFPTDTLDTLAENLGCLRPALELVCEALSNKYVRKGQHSGMLIPTYELFIL